MGCECMGNKARGNLLIIGGAEDKTGSKEILRFFADLVREDGPVLLVTTASEAGEEIGQAYEAAFNDLKIPWEILSISSRRVANSSETVGRLRRAGAVFFTGGDQLRLTSILGGTQFYYALHSAYEEGLLIAGTSAGAAAMSDTMIVGGIDDESPKKDVLRMAPGMGFLEEAVVDQHFAQRGRIGRLVAVIAQNPHVLGIGIDEDTAVYISDDGKLKVIGNNTVTILDGTQVTISNASESSVDQPLAVTGLCVHVLAKGFGFDLVSRRPYAIEN